MNTHNNGKFEIYPNPANEDLTIALNNTIDGLLVSVRLYDAQGQQVVEQSFSDKINLNISAFKGGVYYVKLTSKQFTEGRKIVIK